MSRQFQRSLWVRNPHSYTTNLDAHPVLGRVADVVEVLAQIDGVDWGVGTHELQRVPHPQHRAVERDAQPLVRVHAEAVRPLHSQQQQCSSARFGLSEPLTYCRAHLNARHELAELLADERATRVRRVHVRPQAVPCAHGAQRSEIVERATRRRAPRTQPLQSTRQRRRVILAGEIYPPPRF